MKNNILFISFFVKNLLTDIARFKLLI